MLGARGPTAQVIKLENDGEGLAGGEGKDITEKPLLVSMEQKQAGSRSKGAAPVDESPKAAAQSTVTQLPPI